MPRNVPAELKLHLQQEATTTTTLIRIDPLTPGFDSYGAAMVDFEVIYNDGFSTVAYSPIVGMQLSTLATSLDMSVDNGESTALLPEFDMPISEADIRAGVYDYARWTAYLVNYEDLSMGHVVLGHGQLGKVTVNDDGISFVEELFGLTKQLRQSIVERDSLTCRAVFGSQPIGTNNGAPEQRFPCGFDATSLLVDGVVESVGLETNITFTDSSLEYGEDALNPGMVYWQTGMNAGRENEVDTNTADGQVTLAFKSDYPIAVGDTFKIRPDCNKQARDTAKGCKSHWEAEWPLHFRGEPDIPIGDAGALNTPGATVGPGNGGMTSQEISSEAVDGTLS